MGSLEADIFSFNISKLPMLMVKYLRVYHTYTYCSFELPYFRVLAEPCGKARNISCMVGGGNKTKESKKSTRKLSEKFSCQRGDVLGLFRANGRRLGVDVVHESGQP